MIALFWKRCRRQYLRKFPGNNAANYFNICFKAVLKKSLFLIWIFFGIVSPRNHLKTYRLLFGALGIFWNYSVYKNRHSKIDAVKTRNIIFQINLFTKYLYT